MLYIAAYPQIMISKEKLKSPTSEGYAGYAWRLDPQKKHQNDLIFGGTVGLVLTFRPRSILSWSKLSWSQSTNPPHFCYTATLVESPFHFGTGPLANPHWNLRLPTFEQLCAGHGALCLRSGVQEASQVPRLWQKPEIPGYSLYLSANLGRLKFAQGILSVFFVLSGHMPASLDRLTTNSWPIHLPFTLADIPILQQWSHNISCQLPFGSPYVNSIEPLMSQTLRNMVFTQCHKPI